MVGSQSFNARGNYFEFGTAVTGQSPAKLATEEKLGSSKGSNAPQKQTTNTSGSTKLHQNPLASALFKSKTHMTGADKHDAPEPDPAQGRRKDFAQKGQKSHPTESDPDVTVENFEATLSSRQVSHVSQHSGSQRLHLQNALQPVQERLGKKKAAETRQKGVRSGEYAPPSTVTKKKEQTCTEAKFQSPTFRLGNS